MTTPAIILAILLLPLAGAHVATRRLPDLDPRIGGIVGLVCAFAFFGIGHFAATDGMVEMLPPQLPAREALVYATGVLEWLLAAGLAWPQTRRAAGCCCIVVLVAFFPANIYAAVNSVGLGGHQWGPIYLLIRAPLQLLLIFWSWWFVVRSNVDE